MMIAKCIGKIPNFCRCIFQMFLGIFSSNLGLLSSILPLFFCLFAGLIQCDIEKRSKNALPIVEELEAKGLLDNPPIETPEWIKEEIKFAKNSQGIREQILASSMGIDMFEFVFSTYLTLIFIGILLRIYVHRLNTNSEAKK
jgi:hypothetical protein